MKLLINSTLSLFTSSLLLGCASFDMPLKYLTDKTEFPTEKWQEQSNTAAVSENWIKEFNNTELEKFITQAIENNRPLKQEFYNVEIKKQNVISSGSSLFPSLDFNLNRTKTGAFKSGKSAGSASVSLDAKYEIDIWNKLSDAEKQAEYELLATEAKFADTKQQLVTNITVLWLEIIQNQSRIKLYNLRIKNLENLVKIATNSYQKGIIEVTDVYAAENNLAAEIEQLSEQKTLHITAIRELEKALGLYPAGTLKVTGEIPTLSENISTGLPADLIERKPQIIASWNSLLATNSALAFAHKKRLPSLSLNASLSNSDDNLGQLFSPVPLAWSLLGNLTSPIFNADNLKALEESARLEVRKAEQNYLEVLYTAYMNVENKLTAEKNLINKYDASEQKLNNRIETSEINHSKYRLGLISYADYLNAQNLQYATELNHISLKKSLIENRTQLHLALGGDFNNAPISGE